MDSYTSASAQTVPGSFYLATCQRKIWVSKIGTASLASVHSAAELLAGVDAYRFLLRVATGLESQVKGETDIFGQVKEAWKNFVGVAETAEMGGMLQTARDLSSWMQRLFEDTKDIRKQYLQNVGGDSYGSLTRKLLKKFADEKGEIGRPVLLIGAGQIAQSVAPWLGSEIWISNRSRAAAEALRSELIAKTDASVRILETEEEVAMAWGQAAHAVICIPPSEPEDSQRIALWNAGSASSKKPRALIHLGGVREQLSVWNRKPQSDTLFTLDDLFALQREQNEARQELFKRAERACEEKAQLRSLSALAGASASLPHGWEDLAIFA